MLTPFTRDSDGTTISVNATLVQSLKPGNANPDLTVIGFGKEHYVVVKGSELDVRNQLNGAMR